ncbi:MAG TPA: [acyl-carrier-protein] S-malonyltransferase [Gemmatimonadetes bacterium]|nr:[acyl-carrier-protein] S-malonyltransferase [Gemmatimonadota bacterium]HAT38360.1 [acyl-carrier-protein] S-malonyltransferase [Gemmatimonadota bacterium]
MTLALLFPGQGSQHVGMGSGLAAGEPVASEVFAEADEALGFSLSSLMRDGPSEELTETQNAQPALLAHSVAALRVLGIRYPTSTSPAFGAGHSLGEFSAYVAAGTVTFVDALRAVRLRGELMSEAGKNSPGTMAAILGLNVRDVREVCKKVSRGVCVPANFNSAGQVVISGDLPGVEEGIVLAKEAGAKRAIQLNVSGAFHSPLMEPAAEELKVFLDGIEFSDPTFPVIANATADPVTTGDQARTLLVRQLVSPVRWTESIEVMTSSGVDRFLEIGSGRVLTTLNRRNAKGLQSSALGEPEDFNNLEV